MTSDFLVVGGGVVGLTIASALKRGFADTTVTLVEKEARLGAHASGRNSGVLHAGFYYADDSLKARFSREGNRRLTEHCLQRGLRINRCGKLVVAQTEADFGRMEELERRAQVNGIKIDSISIVEMREIEPRARSLQRALFSPNTASVDPAEVLESLAADARAMGVEIRAGTTYMAHRGHAALTTAGPIHCGYVVNAAGLYADKIALDYGFSTQYRILPFKGLYLHADPGERLRTNVYPVPDLRNPFAGVHFSVGVGGCVKIGPTAVPALWREQYGLFAGFSPAELIQIVGRHAGLFARNDFGFRRLAISEARKYSRKRLVAMGQRLVSGIDLDRYRRWGQPGIRAQLLNIRSRSLVMDFVTEGDDRSFHVLNAVSPAFTCALPFADYVVERITDLIQ